MTSIGLKPLKGELLWHLLNSYINDLREFQIENNSNIFGHYASSFLGSSDINPCYDPVLKNDRLNNLLFYYFTYFIILLVSLKILNLENF